MFGVCWLQLLFVRFKVLCCLVRGVCGGFYQTLSVALSMLIMMFVRYRWRAVDLFRVCIAILCCFGVCVLDGTPLY